MKRPQWPLLTVPCCAGWFVCRTVYTITQSSTRGSDALAAASAALAASAVAINQSRPMLAAQALSRARLLYQWASSAAIYNTTYCGVVVPCEGSALPLHGSWSVRSAGSWWQPRCCCRALGGVPQQQCVG